MIIPLLDPLDVGIADGQNGRSWQLADPGMAMWSKRMTRVAATELRDAWNMSKLHKKGSK